MKRINLCRLSGEYLAALKTYMEQVPPADLQAAHVLSVKAAALKLEIPDMAKMHDAALAALLSPGGDAAERNTLTAKAAVFFTEAITLIKKTHRHAGMAGTGRAQVNEALARRTLDLSAAHCQLRTGIAGRKEADEGLQTGKGESTRLLTEAWELQQHLQGLARQILSAQEKERKRMSLALQDGVAQTLLAIHVRLLALDRKLSVSSAGFRKEVAITQRLVQDSLQVINRFALECSIEYET